MSKKVSLLDNFSSDTNNKCVFKHADLKKLQSETSKPEGSCEFVGASIYEGSVGRRCTLEGKRNCFFFCEPMLVQVCPTRKDKLASLGGSK